MVHTCSVPGYWTLITLGCAASLHLNLQDVVTARGAARQWVVAPNSLITLIIKRPPVINSFRLVCTALCIIMYIIKPTLTAFPIKM